MLKSQRLNTQALEPIGPPLLPRDLDPLQDPLGLSVCVCKTRLTPARLGVGSEG